MHNSFNGDPARMATHTTHPGLWQMSPGVGVYPSDCAPAVADIPSVSRDLELACERVYHIGRELDALLQAVGVGCSTASNDPSCTAPQTHTITNLASGLVSTLNPIQQKLAELQRVLLGKVGLS